MASELRDAMKCRTTTKPTQKISNPPNPQNGDDGHFHPISPYTPYGFVVGKDGLN